MEYLKNLSAMQIENLASLLQIKPGRVVSMSLSKKEGCAISLLGFADGEGVSEESYFGDTLYYVLEGEMAFRSGEEELLIKQGECTCVPEGALHAIGEASAFKVLQITLGK